MKKTMRNRAKMPPPTPAEMRRVYQQLRSIIKTVDMRGEVAKLVRLARTFQEFDKSVRAGIVVVW